MRAPSTTAGEATFSEGLFRSPRVKSLNLGTNAVETEKLRKIEGVLA